MPLLMTRSWEALTASVGVQVFVLVAVLVVLLLAPLDVIFIVLADRGGTIRRHAIVSCPSVMR